MNQQLKEILQDYKEIPLSSTDIKRLLGDKVKIVKYPDIHKYDSIEELLSPFDCAIILYEYRESFGHWCSLLMSQFEDGTKTAEFFDSYGNPMDYVLSKIPEPWRTESDQNYPYLTRLMYNSPYECSYNEFKFQKLGPKISSCGRWSVLRCLFKELPLNEFKELFYGPKSDELATFLTMEKSQVEEVK